MISSKIMSAATKFPHVRAFTITYFPLPDRPVQQNAEWQTAFANHKAWLNGIEAKGRLLFGGGLEVNAAKPNTAAAPSISGLVVVLAKDLAEAEEMASQDPLLKEGYRAHNVQTWNVTYGHSELAEEFVRVSNVTLHDL
ncbi:hypothetical protein HDU99_002706 [Rhizoclosmatium hyalinum]|nr:hypothetical protein HDU99_002706 [Rhizoclosmatium hyalinum]